MENGIREQSYFYLCHLCRSQQTFRPQMKAGPPRGPPRDVFKLSGGRFRISGIASQGAHHAMTSS
jgi:hypothetical protein